MSNPLDDAFAKAEAARAAEARWQREKERATEQAVRGWMKAYGEVLAAVPRYVKRPPERVTLAWLSESEPPSSVERAGTGKSERGSSFGFGSCEVWRFEVDLGEKCWSRFLVSADCTAVLTTQGSVTLKQGLWRSTRAEMLKAFADVRTGRHTLRLDASPGSGESPYSVYRSNLLSPESLAKFIARHELGGGA